MKTQSLLAGRYRIERRIGAGGMGDVYRATDTVLHRPVAVKQLRSDDPTIKERFRREALTAASISHPAVAAVHDYVEDDGTPAIVMELVDGETLSERLRREPLTPAEVGLIGAEAAAALDAAHRRGVVHRDIKPSNIMLTPSGGVKVMDFGIARTPSHDTLTEAGSVLGTPHYLAPEQVRGEPATPSSDLYSLGAVLYEAATGHRPFEGDSSTAVALARLSSDPTPPHAIRPDLPIALDQAIMRSLARDPAERYSDASQLRSALVEAPVAERMRSVPLTERLPTEAEFTEARVPVHTPPYAMTLPRRGRPLRPVAIIAALLIVATTLGVWAATRPRAVLVPKLTGLTEDAAVAAARAAGLHPVLKRAASETVPEGTVFVQSLVAGRKAGRGATITLTVSTGVPTVTVPFIAVASEAGRILAERGLRLGHTFLEVSNDKPAGFVIRSDPPAGETVQQGDSVDIVVAAEPPQPSNERKGKGHKD